MALPRDASLHTDGDKLYLTQRVAAHPEPAGTAHIVERREIPEGVHPLSAEGTNQPCLIEATLAPGKSTECGLIICQGEQEGTHVGYRAQRGELAVDRTRSGDVGFSPHFPGQDTAPVDLIDGRLRLRLLVDSSSVEVFAQDGRVTITNQIFPDPSSRGLAVYAAGGTAQLISLTVTPLRAALLVRHRRPRNRASSRTGHRG